MHLMDYWLLWVWRLVSFCFCFSHYDPSVLFYFLFSFRGTSVLKYVWDVLLFSQMCNSSHQVGFKVRFWVICVFSDFCLSELCNDPVSATETCSYVVIATVWVCLRGRLRKQLGFFLYWKWGIHDVIQKRESSAWWWRQDQEMFTYST